MRAERAREVGRIHASDISQVTDSERTFMVAVFEGLARTFRSHYGTTAGTYLREVRVRRAADALARSSATLSQIALDSGFADQSHFTRVFSAVHGLTPRRWRELHQK